MKVTGLCRAAFVITSILLYFVPCSGAADKKVPLQGFDLYYREFGQGRPLLLLAGGPGFDCDYLEPVAVELGKNFRAVLVELPGTGRSLPPVASPETLGLQATLADLEALRTFLKLDSWTVFGHSAGAVLAMQYATAYPQRVPALVLADSGPPRAALATAMMDNLRAHLSAQERASLDAAFRQDFGQALGLMMEGDFYDRTKYKTIASLLGPANFHANPSRFLGVDEMGQSAGLTDGLRRLHVPALVIAGRQDTADPGIQYEIHLALQGSRLVLLDQCGHFSWVEQPAAFYREVHAFLDSLK